MAYSHHPMDSDIISTDIVVLYHSNCPDGFGSAWAAWTVFGERATYIPVKYGQTFPAGVAGKEVYLIDFSYDADLLPRLERVAKRLVVIDHHKTAAAWVPNCKEYVFDLSKSGAQLTWRYFHPEEPVPLFLDYIGDADLFIFARPNAAEITTYLQTLPLTFETFDYIRGEIENENTRANAVEKGKLLMMYRDKVLEVAYASVHYVNLAGNIIPAVNMCLPISEVSHGLHVIYEQRPPIALSYRYDDGEWRCSLRSNGTKDCAEIAEKFGGGGHPGAAGFSIKAEPHVFPFEIVEKPE